MKHQTWKALATVIALAAILMLGACKKKTAPPPPPPPPPPASPTASISVSPDTIEKGQSATLTWQTSNATDVSIDGIGAVQASWIAVGQPGRFHHLSPGCQRRWRNSGGHYAPHRHPAAAAAMAATPSPTDEDLFGQNVKDIYFDYDKSNIRADQESVHARRRAVPQPASQYQFHD